MKVREKARKSMVNCQLQTNNVLSPDIIYAFETVPREDYLPESMRGIAYVDEDLRLGGNKFLMEPVVFGRMLEAAQPHYKDIVLNVGDTTGYASAILSGLVTSIVTLEPKAGMLDHGRSVWSRMDYCNIAVIAGAYEKGFADHAPYDLIVVNGAVSRVPETLLAQLGRHGRLVAVVRKPGSNTGVITLIRRDSETSFSTQTFYDAATPYVAGFEPVPVFTF